MTQARLHAMLEDLAVLRSERSSFLKDQQALLKASARELQQVEAARLAALKRTLEHEEER
jgi:hypothetical protein